MAHRTYAPPTTFSSILALFAAALAFPYLWKGDDIKSYVAAHLSADWSYGLIIAMPAIAGTCMVIAGLLDRKLDLGRTWLTMTVTGALLWVSAVMQALHMFHP